MKYEDSVKYHQKQGFTSWHAHRIAAHGFRIGGSYKHLRALDMCAPGEGMYAAYRLGAKRGSEDAKGVLAARMVSMMRGRDIYAIDALVRKKYGMRVVQLLDTATPVLRRDVVPTAEGWELADTAIESRVVEGKYYSRHEPRAIVAQVSRGVVHLNVGDVRCEIDEDAYVPFAEAVVQASPGTSLAQAESLMEETLSPRARVHSWQARIAPCSDWVVPRREVRLARSRAKYNYATLVAATVRIGSYHSSHARLNHQTQDPVGARTYGYEWEVCAARGRGRVALARTIIGAVPNSELTQYLSPEHDRSLGSTGVELVSAARPLEQHVRYLAAIGEAVPAIGGKLDENTRKPIDVGMTHARAGLHIHIGKLLCGGRSTFTRRSLSYFHALVDCQFNSGTFQMIAQRPASHYCRYSDQSMATNAGTYYEARGRDLYVPSGHFSVLNQRISTYELRAFRGVTSTYEIAQRLEYVDAMIDYVTEVAELVDTQVFERLPWQMREALLTGLLTNQQVAARVVHNAQRWPAAATMPSVCALAAPASRIEHARVRVNGYIGYLPGYTDAAHEAIFRQFAAGTPAEVMDGIDRVARAVAREAEVEMPEDEDA